MGTFAAALYLELQDQKDRLFLWLPVAFGAGIVLYFSLPFEPGILSALMPIFLTLAPLIVMWRKRHDATRLFVLFLILSAFFLAACGFASSKISAEINGTHILANTIRITQVAGTIESIESLGEGDGSRIVLKNLTLEKIPAAQTPQKIRLRIRKDDGLHAGQDIAVLARINPTSPPVAPGSYDFQRHLYFQGIGGVGFAFAQPTILQEPQNTLVDHFFETLRARIYRSVTDQAGPVTAGIMTALITGQRGAIAEEDNDAMRASGLYHLLSISGSHVGMVSALLFFMTRFFMAAWPYAALHWPIKKIAAGIAMGGAIFYCLLAGADVPAQRAAMMTGLVLFAIMLDRSPFSLRLIAFSALVILVFVPQSLIGVSFQMSFSAVAALICFYDYIEPVWSRFYSRAGFARKLVLYLVGLIFTSAIAGVMTGFFSLYHFQQFAVYGILSNMMAVPLTGIVIMPAAVMALILMPFGGEGFALHIMEWGTVWMLAIAHWTAGLEGAVIHVPQWPQATLMLLSSGIILLLLWRGWRGKGVAMVILVLGLVIGMSAQQPAIMVSQDAGLIAVRGDDGLLYFSSTRKDKFAAQGWLRLAGQEGEKPLSFKDESFPHLCDPHGCRLIKKGQNIALSFDDAAWPEDCAWADIMIAQVPVQKSRCGKEARIYDLFDFKYRHAHAFYLSDHGMHVRSVAAERGNRPWVQ